MGDQIVKSNGGGKSLAIFGERDDIREMADRIKAMMPGTTKLDNTEALTVAQIAVAHGLDPFNGEVWGLKSEAGKWYGVMVGIKGLRKAARRTIRAENGDFWTELRRVEPKVYGAPANSVVYECLLRDTVNVQAWAKSIHSLTSVGVPYADAVAALGPAPVVVGVGIATPEERSKMELHARSRKRAEADAIKQRFDIEFRGAAVTDDEPDYVEAQVSEVAESKPAPSVARPASEIINMLGYEPDPEPPETPEPEQEPEPIQPYADLKFTAQADPSAAFWSLQKRIGLDKPTAEAIVKECNGNMVAAFNALLKQAPA